MRLTPAHISPFAGTRQSKPTPSAVALWNVASSAPPWRGLPGPSMVGRQTTPHDALLPHRRLVRDAAGPPSGPGPGRGPRQRPQRRAGHRLRDVGLSVSLLPRVRARHAAPAGAGVCPDGQGPFRLHQPAPPGRAQKCHRGGGSRPVRRAPAAVLAHARLAVRSSGRMGPTRVPAVVFSRTERFAGTGAGRVRPLCDVRCDRRFRPRRRRASAPRRRHGHAQLLYRRSAARRGGAGRGVPSGAGLDLPEQDGALMRGARPSFIYRLSIRLAQQALPFAARLDKKVARGLEARRGVTARLAAWARAHREPSRPLLWVHASSVGEGLQAKPVLEAVRAEVPQWQLAYTFFSPSAERLARTLPVDIADYLPLDRPAEVSAALDALKPAALVFSKLDVWPELTLAAAQRGVRLGLISATVAPHSSRLRWPARGWAEPAYRALERIGAISAEDGRRLEQLGARPGASEVTGDTRHDSVAGRPSTQHTRDRRRPRRHSRRPVRPGGGRVRGGGTSPGGPAFGPRAGRVRRPAGGGTALAHESRRRAPDRARRGRGARHRRAPRAALPMARVASRPGGPRQSGRGRQEAGAGRTRCGGADDEAGTAVGGGRWRLVEVTVPPPSPQTSPTSARPAPMSARSRADRPGRCEL